MRTADAYDYEDALVTMTSCGAEKFSSLCVPADSGQLGLTADLLTADPRVVRVEDRAGACRDPDGPEESVIAEKF